MNGNPVTNRTETGNGGFDGSGFDSSLADGGAYDTGNNALQILVDRKAQTCNVYLSFGLTYLNVDPTGSYGSLYYTAVIMPGTVKISATSTSIAVNVSYISNGFFPGSLLVETIKGTIQ